MAVQYIQYKKMKKRIIKAFVERNSCGRYCVYFNEDLTCFFFGEGETQEEAIQEFLDEHEDLKEHSLYEKVQEELRCVEFEFHIEVQSYLQYYAQLFSIEGLAKITCISKARLKSYVDGSTLLRPSTAKQIGEGLLKFAEDLKGLELNTTTHI